MRGKRNWRRDALFLVVALAVLGLDQATKGMVRVFMEPYQYFPSPEWPVRLYYVTNTGAAFGILQNQTGFLIVTSVIGIAAIAWYWLSQPQGRTAAVALGMMLGGAAGNLLDRVRLGEVTDFLSFPYYPSFNVADASIVLAFVVLFASYALRKEERPREEVTEGARHEDAGAGS